MVQQLLELARLSKVLFEEARVLFLAHLWQHGRERRLHVSDETEIQRRPAAEMLRIHVNLDLFHVAVRQKLGKRKICPEQQKKIGVRESRRTFRRSRGDRSCPWRKDYRARAIACRERSSRRELST